MADASNAALIVALYDALGRGDGEAMAACYHPDATFEDPAFGALHGDEVGSMWRMLTSRGAGIEVELPEHGADGDDGHARWIARYNFTQTGRDVVNDVSSTFVFEDGLIFDQRDRFDQRRWAAQALGPAGVVLGLTPLLGPLLRRRARAQLAGYGASRDGAPGEP